MRFYGIWVGAIAIAVALVPANAQDSRRKTNNTAEFSHTMTLEPAHESSACEAALSVEYFQKGASVHVDTTLTNDICDASAGTFVIEVRYRGDDGEIKTKSFDETWTRDDDQPVKSSRDYLVADDVDVIRVRSRKLRCECTPAEAEE